MPWDPSLPWPGSPGGASSPRWGGYVRVYVRAALAPGRAFHVGPHNQDRLDAGNVLSGASTVEVEDSLADRLWVDLSCDVLDLAIAGGASTSAGIFSKADAATCQVTLSDPKGIYDPLNPVPPWSYAGRSRLVPGVPIEVWAEVVDGDTAAVTRHDLFRGTADSWGEDWTPSPARRQARMIATDATKTWTRYDRPEQPEVGAGDTTAQRVARLVTFYGWPGTVDPAPTSTVTLQATTLAAPGWELLNRTLDDEIGVVYFTPSGALRWTNRQAWFTTGDPVVELGCPSVETGLADVLVDASPSNLDTNMKNVVHAARTGGTSQTAQSTASLTAFGPYEYNRTDLGLQTDTQAGAWAQDVLVLSAYPRVVLDDVTMVPAIDPRSWEVWNGVLPVEFVTDIVRVVWAPPDRPESVVDARVRVVGYEHRITRAAWELKWQLVAANPMGMVAHVFTMGPHAQDRLDAGNVLALAH